jgi:DNA-binding MarR family transcriptional regulator
VPPLTASQRRLLRLLRQGDLIWEIAEDPRHRTVYDEKLGRSRRVLTATVTVLEEQGWIQRRPNSQEDRLDSWELTPVVLEN